MSKKELKGNLHFIFKSWKLKKNHLIFRLPTGDSIYLPRYRTDYIQRLIFQKNNFYEFKTLERIAKLFKQRNIPCNCVLDIGANIGNHTLYFARHLQSKHVYSFEPCKQNFEMLKKNVALNHLTDKVSVFNCAVGKTNGQGSVSIADENNLGMVSVQETEGGDVRIISLDSILPPPLQNNISLVKIDVEGAEYDVLCGMKQILQDAQNIILLIEIFPENCKKIYPLLRQLGFTKVHCNVDPPNHIYVK